MGYGNVTVKELFDELTHFMRSHNNKTTRCLELAIVTGCVCNSGDTVNKATNTTKV